jgi:hypothetical protein
MHVGLEVLKGVNSVVSNSLTELVLLYRINVLRKSTKIESLCSLL